MEAGFWHQKWAEGDIGFHAAKANGFYPVFTLRHSRSTKMLSNARPRPSMLIAIHFLNPPNLVESRWCQLPLPEREKQNNH